MFPLLITLPIGHLFFGDGLFETMIFKEGEIRFRDGHWNRITEGLQQLKINGRRLQHIGELEAFLVGQFGSHAFLRVRWNIYRSGLGKYSPQENGTDELISIQQATSPPKVKQQTFISTSITVPKSPWSHCKTLNALTYVMANIEREEKGMDEVILKDTSNFISESGIANLFWKKDGTFYTPSLTCSCIAGVSRNALIQHLNHQRIPLIEGEFTEDHLLSADQVFTTNVSGIAYLQRIEGKEFDTSPIAEAESLFN